MGKYHLTSPHLVSSPLLSSPLLSALKPQLYLLFLIISSSSSSFIQDVGGQWVGPGQDRVYALAKKYNIPMYLFHLFSSLLALLLFPFLLLLPSLTLFIFPQWTKGKKVLEYFGTTKTYSGTIPSVNPFALIELQLHTFWIESWASKLQLSR